MAVYVQNETKPQKKKAEVSALRVNVSSKEANFVIRLIIEGLDLGAKECLRSARNFNRETLTGRQLFL